MAKKTGFLGTDNLQTIDYNNDVRINKLETVDSNNNTQMTDVNDTDLKKTSTTQQTAKQLSKNVEI